MHTYIYASPLASNYQKTADVTSDVTRKFRATKIMPSCLANNPAKKYSRHSERFLKSVIDWGNILGPMIRFLTANEVCEWLRLSRKGLWDLERSGELIPDRIGRRLRYREHEIMNYLDKSREKNTLARNGSNQSFENDWKSLAQKISIEPKSHTYIYAQSESLSVEEIDRAFQEQNQQGSIGSAV